MNIILFRHGDAENSSPDINDSERGLTPSGERISRRNAETLRNFIGEPDYIVSSPLKRALQTARILAEVTKCYKEIITDEKLAPGSSAENIVDLTNYLNSHTVIFVGHQPDFSNAVSDLISSSGASVEFRKSAAAKISFSGKASLRRGVLEFLLPPVPEK